MFNSVYGKTMENLSKRVNVRLVNNAKDYKKYVSKLSFVSQNIFSENFVTIHEIKLVLTLDKPIYVGFSILDLSKYFIYYFYYEYAKTTMMLSWYLCYPANVKVIGKVKDEFKGEIIIEFLV